MITQLRPVLLGGLLAGLTGPFATLSASAQMVTGTPRDVSHLGPRPGTNIPGAGALAAGGALSGSYALKKMYDIYSEAPKALFERDASGTRRLTPVEVRNITATADKGDEIRISYMTSDAEERTIRIAELEKNHKNIRIERQLARDQMSARIKANKPREAAIAGNRMKDLSLALQKVEDEIKAIGDEKVPVTSRIAVRRVDLDSVRTVNLEHFLLRRIEAGQDILKIERITAAKRQQLRANGKMVAGSVGMMVLGAFVIFSEIGIDNGELGPDDTLMGSQIYVPEMKSSGDSPI